MEQDLDDEEVKQLKETFSRPLNYIRNEVCSLWAWHMIACVVAITLCMYLILLVASYTGIGFHGNMPAQERHAHCHL